MTSVISQSLSLQTGPCTDHQQQPHHVPPPCDHQTKRVLWECSSSSCFPAWDVISLQGDKLFVDVEQELNLNSSKWVKANLLLNWGLLVVVFIISSV